MDKKQVQEALFLAKQGSKKRHFKQSVDFIVSFKDLDVKKPDNQIDIFAVLHYGRGKKAKIGALIGPELQSQAKEVCDTTIDVDDFPKYAKDKKLAKKLANDHDFFIAQATIMPKVAASFGRIFGPRGKMPNPKAGCVVPPNANLKPLYEKLQKTVKISVKTQPIFQVRVGSEDTKDEEIVDNILSIYNQIVSHTIKGKHNIRKTFLKLTMGPVIQIGKKPEPKQEVKKPSEKKETKKEKNPKTEKKTEEPKKEKPKKQMKTEKSAKEKK